MCDLGVDEMAILKEIIKTRSKNLTTFYLIQYRTEFPVLVKNGMKSSSVKVIL